MVSNIDDGMTHATLSLVGQACPAPGSIHLPPSNSTLRHWNQDRILLRISGTRLHRQIVRVETSVMSS